MAIRIVGGTHAGKSGNITERTQFKDDIQRLNYGILFKDKGQLILGTEYWRQTYALQLPAIPRIHPEKNPCGLVTGPNCKHLQYIASQLHELHHATHRKLLQTLHFINRHVPAPTHSTTQTKRALFGFVAEWSKSLFGTATETDIKTLSRHIKQLANQQTKVLGILTQHGHHMSSYTSLTNKRIDDLQHTVNDNFKAIVNITTEFQQDIDNLETDMVKITQMWNTQTTAALELENDFLELKIAVQNLLAGHLSPVLITKNALSETLTDLQTLLRTQYTKFFLVQTNPEWYYRHAHFHYATHDHILYVTLKFPVSTHERPLQVFKILALPFPISSNTQHASQILNLPDYFVLTDHKRHYTYLTENDMNQCYGHPIHLCNFNKALRPITHPSCVMSLFDNDNPKVKTLCNFRFLPDLISPAVIDLTDNSVLVYNTETIYLNCPRSHKTIPGCQICVIDIPCNCSLQASDWYYPPRLVKCPTNETSFRQLHPINMAVLQHFFNDTAIQSLTGDSLFLKPVDILLPKIGLYKHNFADRLIADQKLHFSLEKVATAVKSDTKIFQSLSEPILEGKLAVPTSWTSLNSILLVISFTISILSCLACIVLFLKMRTLAKTILILTQLVRTKALDSTKIIYKQPSTDAPPSLADKFNEVISWDKLTMVLGLITIFLLILILIKLLIPSKSTSKLFLEVTNGINCVILPLIDLHSCPSFWTIHPPVGLRQFTLSQFPRKLLYANWVEFRVYNKFQTTDSYLEIPQAIPLSWLNYVRLVSILKTPHTAYLLVSHGKHLIPLPDQQMQTNFAYYR